MDEEDDLGGIEEEPYDEFGNTIKGTDADTFKGGDNLEALNRKHEEYASEIEAIKALIGE